MPETHRPEVRETLNQSDAAAILEAAERYAGADIVPISEEVSAALVPSGVTLQSIKPLLDEYLTRPERVKGTARLFDAASFIAHVERFGTPDGAAIFATPDARAPRLLAVYDYHEDEDNANWTQHRAEYQCQVSPEWAAWLEKDGRWFTQGDFAAFIEDRAADVLQVTQIGEALAQRGDLLGGRFAGPAQIVALSRGLALNAEEKIKSAKNLSTGEVQIQYEVVHKDGAGEPLSVPSLFAIGIPVFRGGDGYQVGVRLRYRVSGGSVTWAYNLYRADKVFDHAFDELCASVAEATKLPVLRGAPES